ncbi:iron-siderophore ABC transporter substrate-binding protein [Marinomonas sp. 15G1-11]|uniref:Iron-siderophore ABC transporter substrate-binding protein n=1 Tax=Marinomonas phaeophyticola TaxID=3004091 RepID=A0ABT4JU25_9GAMM|nr:iron-siderophore ABC transporter substrate-binding protein [Marinomonas sp. 15G1-11]MCZ2721849.1 iron-siderophore ABC transporter substrate-binding protein [Marinomonas sp. 15G1-11]
MLILTHTTALYMACIINFLLLFSANSPAETVIQDSQGEVTFKTTPTRVAVLNWALAENVIELGITPIAVPEIKAYREWVVKPAIPDATIDIGNRAEPNLERLAQLKPDVILISDALKSQQARLEHIAPVVVFDTYREDHNNAKQADLAFLTIAKLLNKTALAQQKLTAREEVFNTLSNQLKRSFPNGIPPVTSLRFASTTSAYVYGDNSMPQYALNRLGIEPALSLPTSQWGINQQRLKSLKQIDQGILLYFEPFYQVKKLQESRLWQAMPFVINKHTASVESTWTYGGAMSLKYLAEALTTALLSVAP